MWCFSFFGLFFLCALLLALMLFHVDVDIEVIVFLVWFCLAICLFDRMVIIYMDGHNLKRRLKGANMKFEGIFSKYMNIIYILIYVYGQFNIIELKR